MFAQPSNVLKTTELYNSNEYTEWYVKDNPIKLLRHLRWNNSTKNFGAI